MRIKNKLILMLMIPFIGMLYFAYQDISNKLQEKQEIQVIQQAILVSRFLSELVHDLQQERGLSAGFLGARGKRFQKELLDIRRKSDSSIQRVQNLLRDFNLEVRELNPRAGSKYKILLMTLKQLDNNRRDIDRLDLSIEKILANYNMINSLALNIIQKMAETVGNESITSRFLSYFYLLEIKEKAGIERALLTHIFAEEEISQPQLIRLVSLITQQRFQAQLFKSYADKESKKAYRRIIRGPFVHRLEVLRKLILAKKDGPISQVHAEETYAVATGRINLYQQMATYLSLQLKAHAQRLEYELNLKLWNVIWFSLTIVILSILLVSLILKGIIGPLKQASSVAMRLSTGDLDVKIDTSPSGEPGQLLQAMHVMVENLKAKDQEVQLEKAAKNKTLEDLEVANERLQSLDQLKDELLANVSHELQTPLSGIIGIAESLISENQQKLTPEIRHNLELIFASGNRLSSLVKDLLDFSKLKSKEIRLQKIPVAVKSNVGLCLDFSKSLLSGKGIVLINRIPDDLPFVIADEDRLQQILMNLIGNAIKFTWEGEIIIAAEILGDQLRIMVKDSGIGIPLEEQERIFQSFEQLDGLEHKKFRGTGLGLSITKRLVELHHGKIGVESEVQKGATFWFTLPISQEKPDISSQSENLIQGVRLQTELLSHQAVSELEWTAPELDKGSSLKRILVVDDDAVSRQVLRNQLSPEGFSILSARDGVEGLQVLQEEIPDLILLDLMMPRMNGYEFCQRVREEYDMSTLPIIILTAKNQAKDMVQSLQSGANDYLTKPFQKVELMARVQNQIKLKQNNELKQKLVQQVQVEKELIASKYKLVKMIQASENALVFVNEKEEVTYGNQRALKLLNYQIDELTELSLNELFSPLVTEQNEQVSLLSLLGEKESLFQIHPKGQSSCEGQISSFEIIQDDKAHIALIFQINNRQEGLLSPATQGQQFDQQRKTLEVVCAQVTRLSREENTSIAECLLTLEQSLDQLTEEVIQEMHPLQLRKNVVRLMSLALQSWEEATGKTKFELAEESGLWKVYQDQGQIRTRTLDKYFKLKLLPKNPRWKTVIKTVEYVMKWSGKDKRKLGLILSQFKNDLENQNYYF